MFTLAEFDHLPAFAGAVPMLHDPSQYPMIQQILTDPDLIKVVSTYYIKDQEEAAVNGMTEM